MAAADRAAQGRRPLVRAKRIHFTATFILASCGLDLEDSAGEILNRARFAAAEGGSK